MFKEITCYTVSALARLIRSKELSPVEVTKAFLERIELINPQLNAVVTVASDALEWAREAEKIVMRGNSMGPLHGVPITIKDTIDTALLRATAGSVVYKDHIPQKDAPVVSRLKAAGAMVIAKTNVPEMAATYDCENPLFPRTCNPYDCSRTSGGSSGGEAAAIAACLSPGGLGSDLSGSVRVPAFFCGICGLKPTADPLTIPTAGHHPAITRALEYAAAYGPMARSIEDVALLFSVTAGQSPMIVDPQNFKSTAAFLLNDGVNPVDPAVEQTVQRVASALDRAGIRIGERKPPGIEHASRLWLDLYDDEVAELLHSIYSNSGQKESAGRAVRKILNRRSDPTESAVKQDKALKEHAQLRSDIAQFFAEFSVIIAPVGSGVAFEHGARHMLVGSDSRVPLFRAFGYSQYSNVFNLPAASVPVCLNEEGLPSGVQVIGPPRGEKLVLEVAAIIEDAFGGWQPPAVPLSRADDNPV